MPIQQPCSKCGVSLAPSDVLFNSDARVVCEACVMKSEIVRDENNAARNLRRAGWSALAFGVVAFLGPISSLGWLSYVFAAGAVMTAAFAITGAGRRDDIAGKHLSRGQRLLIYTECTLGLALCALMIEGVPLHLVYKHLIR
jgi:hypothetical protein